MLVNSDGLLNSALKNGYAIPAYNINNIEWTRFILEACDEDKSPVILAVTQKTIDYFGGYKIVFDVVRDLINELKIKIPVVLHLDHGLSVESCKMAIDAGFTSVMLDASNECLEDNITHTNEVISYAKRKNVSVEAEIGKMKGEEDGVLSGLSYTSAEESNEFVMGTGVDSLAPAIGNAHGIYKTEPNLDFELLGAICKSTKIPLVLHGASGLDDNKIKTAIFCGVSKININTDLQVAWANAVRKYLADNNLVYDPRKIIKSGEIALKKEIHKKNLLFGSKNRAF